MKLMVFLNCDEDILFDFCDLALNYLHDTYELGPEWEISVNTDGVVSNTIIFKSKEVKFKSKEVKADLKIKGGECEINFINSGMKPLVDRLIVHGFLNGWYELDASKYIDPEDVSILLGDVLGLQKVSKSIKNDKQDLKEYNIEGSIDLHSLISDVKFNPPATIVFWNDGTKTVVKASEFDDYDPEKGFMLCIMKYLLKPQLTEDKKLRSYYKTITDYTDKFEEDCGCNKGWLEEFIESFYNFTLDEDFCDDESSNEKSKEDNANSISNARAILDFYRKQFDPHIVSQSLKKISKKIIKDDDKEPNLTCEKENDSELKIDVTVDLDKDTLNCIYGCDIVDAIRHRHKCEENNKESNLVYEKGIDSNAVKTMLSNEHIVFSIVDKIRNDSLNMVRFCGERPYDIKLKESKSVYFALDDVINNVYIIYSSDFEFLYKILFSLYTLTVCEIHLYHCDDYNNFAIRINDVLILLFKHPLNGDVFSYYHNVTNNKDKRLLIYECYTIMSSDKCFDEFIDEILNDVLKLKGEKHES